MTQLGLEPGPLDRESGALTVRIGAIVNKNTFKGEGGRLLGRERL